MNFFKKQKGKAKPLPAGGPHRSSPMRESFKKEERTAWLIMTPMFLWWILACGFPIAFGFVLGFFEWRSVIISPKFVGFKNFLTFFTSPDYLRILGQTLFLGAASTCLTALFGLMIALLMYRPIRGSTVFRTVWYMPSVVSAVAVTQIIGILFDPVSGALNVFLEGLGMDPVILATDYGWSVMVILAFSVWKGVGGSAIIWLAGLLSIDKGQYEAAELDGAGGWQKFRYITLPGLRPMAIYVIVTSLIGMLQIYEPVAFITNGAPYGKTEVLVLKIIRDGFFDSDFGMSGASSLILGIIVAFMSISFYLYSNRRRED